MEFQKRFEQYVTSIEAALPAYLRPKEPECKTKIYDAVQYSLQAGGKRLRPMLLLEFCRVCGGSVSDAMPFACALEMIHTYSLIHDDLPCMDDDDLRRGKPTSHKVYGEALAVLAGDALLNRAFEIMLSKQAIQAFRPEDVLSAVSYIAQCSGMDGMIGGQVLDIGAEGQRLTVDELIFLQRLKTGKLIEAGTVSGCILAGRSDEATLQAARTYARALGLAFQIRDDILDVEGNTEILGKAVGSDERGEKATFPAAIGMEHCRKAIADLTKEAVTAASKLKDPVFLVQLAHFLSAREK